VHPKLPLCERARFAALGGVGNFNCCCKTPERMKLGLPPVGYFVTHKWGNYFAYF
jgi:hypothetical protein